MNDSVFILISAAGAIMFLVIGGLSLLAHYYTLNGIKSRIVGDGQHRTLCPQAGNQEHLSANPIPPCAVAQG